MSSFNPTIRLLNPTESTEVERVLTYNIATKEVEFVEASNMAIPTLNQVALEDNEISVPIKGTEYFEDKEANDFAQIEDLPKPLDYITIYNINKGCYVIESNDGKIYMVDCGEEYMGYEAVDFIQNKLGKNKVEQIYITHYHYNHVGGLAPIINSMDVGAVLTNGAYSDETREPYGTLDPLAEIALLDAIATHNVPYSYHKQGDEFIEGDLTFKFWSPLEENFLNGGKTDDPNGPTGAMIGLEFKDLKVLFGGDVNREVDILPIWSEQGDVNTDVFAWPHHGDPNTAKDNIVDAMNLKYAFIEDLSRSGMVVNYLRAKHIDYGWLIGNEYTGVKGFEDGTYEKFERRDFEYETLELYCENQVELELLLETKNDLAYRIDYGDGNSEVKMSGSSFAYASKHTYEEPFTGNIIISMEQGGLADIEKMRSRYNSFKFDIAVLPKTLKEIDFSSSATMAVYGDIADAPTDLVNLKLTGIAEINGDIADAPRKLESIYTRRGVLTGNLDLAPRTLKIFNPSNTSMFTGSTNGLPRELEELVIRVIDFSFDGDVNDLPRKLRILNVFNETKINGDVKNLPETLEEYYIWESEVSGNIEDFPATTTFIRARGSSTIKGDLGGSPEGVVTLILTGDNLITSYTTKSWSERMIEVYVKTDITSSEIDLLLMDLSEVVWISSKTLTIDNMASGENRTSASDAAFSELQSKGVTVTITI